MSENSKENEPTTLREGDSILPVVAEKERELENRIREAREETDRQIAAARKEQEERVARERQALAAEKDVLVRHVLEKAEPEIQKIRDTVDARIAALRDKAEGRMDRAVAAALRLILPGGKQT